MQQKVHYTGRHFGCILSQILAMKSIRPHVRLVLLAPPHKFLSDLLWVGEVK